MTPSARFLGNMRSLFVSDPVEIIALLCVIIGLVLVCGIKGGFKTFFALVWQGILLAICYAIHPYLMWGVLAFAIVYVVCKKLKLPLLRVVIACAVIGTIVLAFFHIFIETWQSQVSFCAKMSNYRRILRWVFLAFL